MREVNILGMFLNKIYYRAKSISPHSTFRNNLKMELKSNNCRFDLDSIDGLPCQFTPKALPRHATRRRRFPIDNEIVDRFPSLVM